MVIDAFLALLTALLNAQYALLPSWTITIDPGTFRSFFGMYTLYDAILPVSETGVVLSLFVARFVFSNGLKWVKSIISLCTGGGGAS